MSLADDTIVITGLGAVGPYGSSTEELWAALLAGQPVAGPSRRFAGAPLVGEIVDFDLNRFRRSAKAQRSPRVSQYALAAAAQAIKAAGLDAKGVDKDAVGIVYGTGNGPSDIIERNLECLHSSGLGGIEPLCFQESVFNAPASMVSIEYGFRGPLIALPMGWAAGGIALCQAADMVRFGHARAVLVLAADEMGHLGHQAFSRIKLVSPADGGDEATRPFDRRHNGILMAEGSAALVIERLDHARARGARALCELAGWALTGDASPVGPKDGAPEGIADAMRQALAEAGEPTADVIYAGSYCTRDADLAEARAIHAICPDARVANLRGVVGEAKAPSGLLNVIAGIQTLASGVVAPTAGFDEADPDQPPLALSNRPVEMGAVRSVLANGLWVHGLNSACLLRGAA